MCVLMITERTRLSKALEAVRKFASEWLLARVYSIMLFQLPFWVAILMTSLLWANMLRLVMSFLMNLFMPSWCKPLLTARIAAVLFFNSRVLKMMQLELWLVFKLLAAPIFWANKLIKILRIYVFRQRSADQKCLNTRENVTNWNHLLHVITTLLSYLMFKLQSSIRLPRKSHLHHLNCITYFQAGQYFGIFVELLQLEFV